MVISCAAVLARVHQHESGCVAVLARVHQHKSRCVTLHGGEQQTHGRVMCMSLNVPLYTAGNSTLHMVPAQMLMLLLSCDTHVVLHVPTAGPSQPVAAAGGWEWEGRCEAAGHHLHVHIPGMCHPPGHPHRCQLSTQA